MEIVLSNKYKSITGTLSKKHGYAIRKQNNRFIGVRNSKGHVPPEGHLRFIFDCADMELNRMIIVDIQIKGQELIDAYIEAGYEPSSIAADVSYNAHEVINIKKQEGFEV